MPLESATFISQLTATNPAAGDLKSEGDDHLRLLKSVLQSQFPNLGAAAVTPTAAQLNFVTGVTSAIQSQLDGKAPTASPTFTGTVTVPSPTNSTDAVTKAYADALTVLAGNVATGGTVGQIYRKNSSTNFDASWATPTSSGLVLIATLTPTAAANVDFLSTFNGTYDNYLIIGQGIKPSADDVLLVRFANAGVVDSGSVYVAGTLAGGSAYSTTATSVGATGTITSAGKGGNIHFSLLNVNDAANLKHFTNFGSSQESATPTYINVGRTGVYTGAAVSGMRFFFNGGANFQATGRIRVYGYNNT